jgi:hypothetical protein
MTPPHRRAALIGLISVYLISLGFVSGMVIERMRYDMRRGAVLAELAEAKERLHNQLMALEGRTTRRLD